MKRFLYLILLGVGGALLLRSYGIEGIYVATPSMEPTLPVGTHYFVDKLSFFFRSPKHGEIIVFVSPVNPDKDLIKRVIGCPKETIAIEKKKVFLNHEPLNEPYARYTRKDEILVGDNIPDIEIPEDSYFVMGDNRDESGDSRDWKDPESGEQLYFVHKKLIKGRILNVLE
ncbi:MAG: signal peptidase I [Elusimicrobia bacterium RIFCSPLOWO2_02_FULL_39_32]|nr:MAG: signal peptidase I [Elusimicrobia bacterium GWA2_38_7]OGR79291.1 MAG: signal peptidase I [Elusimicrobia bacterium RIFCSPHIGHO2_02_FULL_39_36]OGR93192.1 MAG: signal peptidase I [Elusimicrobia bacterium RIFCSPLOWO2_02_FULL_39_32]OGR99417.1 MAG: signal peptidase I [Elusimicrobia bacterium RIFCSPLOWO2_12_FULL_39_28]